MPLAFVPLLIAAIGRVLIALVTFFASHKLLLAGLVTIVLPLVVSNIIYGLLEKYFGLVQEQLTLNLPSGGSGPLSGSPFLLELSGLAGWLAVKLHLPEALSYVLGASAARFALSFIPFVGGK